MIISITHYFTTAKNHNETVLDLKHQFLKTDSKLKFFFLVFLGKIENDVVRNQRGVSHYEKVGEHFYHRSYSRSFNQ